MKFYDNCPDENTSVVKKWAKLFLGLPAIPLDVEDMKELKDGLDIGRYLQLTCSYDNLSMLLATDTFVRQFIQLK